MKFDLVPSSDRERIGNGESCDEVFPVGVTSAHVTPTDTSSTVMTAGSAEVASRSTKLAISSVGLVVPMFAPVDEVTSGGGAVPPNVFVGGLTHNDTVSLVAAGMPEKV